MSIRPPAVHGPATAPSSTGAALVVHDLKNDLGALEARLEQLALQPATAPATQALQQCRLLRERLVMYLTVYGHEGRLRAHVEDESPHDLLRTLAAQRGVGGPAPADDAPAVWVFDRRLVMLALQAAVHNALRHAATGPAGVTLSVRTEAGHLIFVVDDDGPGPDPQCTPDGTGLGTALCRAVAQAHGTAREDGGVRLTRRAPAGGGRFELWLAA